MKAINFFADSIKIRAHSATLAGDLDRPISLADFANGRPLALYQMENGDLRAEVRLGAGVPTCFIEGPEVGEPGTASAIPARVASVQVQTTIQTATDIHICAAADEAATHWSVYLRDASGIASHVKDFEIKNKNPNNVGTAKTSALVRAASLSMEHQVPIEMIK